MVQHPEAFVSLLLMIQPVLKSVTTVEWLADSLKERTVVVSYKPRVRYTFTRASTKWKDFFRREPRQVTRLTSRSKMKQASSEKASQSCMWTCYDIRSKGTSGQRRTPSLFVQPVLSYGKTSELVVCTEQKIMSRCFLFLNKYSIQLSKAPKERRLHSCMPAFLGKPQMAQVFEPGPDICHLHMNMC